MKLIGTKLFFLGFPSDKKTEKPTNQRGRSREGGKSINKAIHFVNIRSMKNK